jgi:hypothetical protein
MVQAESRDVAWAPWNMVFARSKPRGLIMVEGLKLAHEEGGRRIYRRRGHESFWWPPDAPVDLMWVCASPASALRYVGGGPLLSTTRKRRGRTALFRIRRGKPTRGGKVEPSAMGGRWVA